MFVILWKPHSDRGVSRHIEYHKFIFADDVFCGHRRFFICIFPIAAPAEKEKSSEEKLPSMTEEQRMKNEEDVLDVREDRSLRHIVFKSLLPWLIGADIGIKTGQKAKNGTKTVPCEFM